MTSKPFPALCKDCKYSVADVGSPWSNRCFNPKVVSKNAWALATTGIGGEATGVTCTEERRTRSWFAFCGMKGKLWEAK